MSSLASFGASWASVLSTTAAGTINQIARGCLSLETKSSSDPAPVAPSLASAWTLAGVMSNATHSCPPFISRRTIFAPMRPNPIIPSCIEFLLSTNGDCLNSRATIRPQLSCSAYRQACHQNPTAPLLHSTRKLRFQHGPATPSLRPFATDVEFSAGREFWRGIRGASFEHDSRTHLCCHTVNGRRVTVDISAVARPHCRLRSLVGALAGGGTVHARHPLARLGHYFLFSRGSLQL